MADNNNEHSHTHDVSSVKGINLLITMLLNLTITVAEVIGGLYSGSLSLLSDALHNFSDMLAIAVSYFAIKISKKSNDRKRTFGYKRSTIIAALINSTVLIVISVYLFKEAYFKFINPEEINGVIVIWVALIGLIANAFGAYLLSKGSKEDMNMKSTYLHLISDALSSVGVVIGGILIYYFSIYWVDPLLTIIIAIYILKESYEILKQAINILMQGIPENININELVKELEEIESIKNVHHVHIWGLNENNIFFEGHVNLKQDILVSETTEIYKNIEHELKEHFGISHITIQFGDNCCEDIEVVKNE
ncbi:cation diffusion facilitator family transporter [Clostridium vincentii]|uniref:Cadmium, cobalt and zinc/H(+)-K(+) antiporter n=1 Tax=Clostridium vincentii TaxID=52704 RepID=A0A2T0B9E6_9CLOT|nr:cation diffusion facilitator family transporter [Clostridium vincentii]PRR80453.1 Cadmium, cobalt and zinc/H(+)-K(+) antiporter [Clostridium vincentii]